MALTLEQVETAIQHILETGQSYTIDGVTYTKANLRDLSSLRARLQDEANNATNGNILGRALVGRPRRGV